jgi:hypothetical protein
VVFACGRLHRSVEKTWRVEAVESDVGRRGWVTREEAAPYCLGHKNMAAVGVPGTLEVLAPNRQ